MAAKVFDLAHEREKRRPGATLYIHGVAFHVKCDPKAPHDEIRITSAQGHDVTLKLPEIP